MSGDDTPEGTVQDQLVRAARDLWTMVIESGEDYIVFVDRRRLQARVERGPDDRYFISWESETEDSWIDYERPFEALREAAFRAYQGPH